MGLITRELRSKRTPLTKFRERFAKNEASHTSSLRSNCGRGCRTGPRVQPVRLRVHEQHHGFREAQPAGRRHRLPALLPGSHRLHVLDLAPGQQVLRAQGPAVRPALPRSHIRTQVLLKSEDEMESKAIFESSKTINVPSAK